MNSEQIRIAQRVLLEAIVDLFANPPAEIGAKEDLHLHMWQIEKMLDFTDDILAELDRETKARLTTQTDTEKETRDV